MDLHSLKMSVQEQFNSCAQFYTTGSQMADHELLELIVRLAEPQAEDQALDVACGAGFLVCGLARSARRAVGVDLSQAMLAEAVQHAISRGLANTGFQHADGETLPYPDETFDIVTCKLALHYFPNPMRLIGEMQRVAKRGGRLMLIDRVASEDRRKREYHNHIEKLRTPSKVKVYATSEIVEMLEHQGLTIDIIQYYEQTQDVDDWLKSTGASPLSRQRARELLMQSLAGDLTGLKLRCEGERLLLPHLTAIIRAKKDQ